MEPDDSRWLKLAAWVFVIGVVVIIVMIVGPMFPHVSCDPHTALPWLQCGGNR
jgi:hypothetical protein